jgi:hypothetical protein
MSAGCGIPIGQSDDHFNIAPERLLLAPSSGPIRLRPGPLVTIKQASDIEEAQDFWSEVVSGPGLAALE